MVTREDITKHLQTKLKSNPNVYALWLEGADAKKNVDEYSDLDLWLDVEDKEIDQIIEEIKNHLKELSPLDLEYELAQPHPQIRHYIMHFKDSSEYLLLDICIQQHSRNFTFTQDLPDHKTLILFDKANVIAYKELSEKEKQIHKEAMILELKKAIVQVSRIKKWINRGNFIQACAYYNKYILEPLRELVLMHKEKFETEFIDKIENLYKVHSLQDITMNIEEAIKLFKTLCSL